MSDRLEVQVYRATGVQVPLQDAVQRQRPQVPLVSHSNLNLDKPKDVDYEAVLPTKLSKRLNLVAI
jgi:hypothetical protein